MRKFCGERSDKSHAGTQNAAKNKESCEEVFWFSAPQRESIAQLSSFLQKPNRVHSLLFHALLTSSVNPPDHETFLVQFPGDLRPLPSCKCAVHQHVRGDQPQRFEHDVPLSDSMHVELILTNPNAASPCCISDTLVWRENEIIPNVFIGSWTFIGNHPGADCAVSQATQPEFDQILLHPFVALT
jgi:hypothetical protein